MNTIQNYQNSIYPLLKELCAIPAPSHHEEQRAEFCKNYLLAAGYTSVFIDEAKNVICEVNGENSNELTVFAAHTDTVFPDITPMPFREENGIAYCPGIGDDTASLAVLLVAARYIKENNLIPRKGVLFVCNSCEEGLGNLKGVKALCERYRGRIARFISFDSNVNVLNGQCVGSHRYCVEVTTPGGHSFNAFGQENALAHLAGIIQRIYEIDVPVYGNSKTTYNVGTVQGGTSVNTIAQHAQMLCEYRSDDLTCLAIMKEKFEKIFQETQVPGVTVTVTKVGDRPCSKDVDEETLARLVASCKEVIENIICEPVKIKTASTDCNIPMAQGIPSVAIGVYRGGGAHTREEWINIDSLTEGFAVAINVIGLYL